MCPKNGRPKRPRRARCRPPILLPRGMARRPVGTPSAPSSRNASTSGASHSIYGVLRNAGTMADIAEIIDNFSVLDDWDDRYRYLIELGRELPLLAEAAHNDANKVQGCASQVWLDTRVRPNGTSGP